MALACCTKRDDDFDEGSSEGNVLFWLGISRRLGCGPRPAKDSIPEGLQFTDNIVCSGGDKLVLTGEYKGRGAVVVVGITGHEFRLEHEVKILKQLGRHPHIIELLCSGRRGKQPIYAMEAVEPVGYDMNRLINQFNWLGDPLPSSLSHNLIDQLVSALSFMHLRGILHRDVKTQNVLVAPDNTVKLIDMGIACQIGTRGELRNAYMAPEVCKSEIQTTKVDCFGVGLILHEIYQREIDLLEVEGEVRMRRGIPSVEHPMPEKVREAMLALLTMDPSQRWSLEDLLRSPWFSKEVFSNLRPKLRTMRTAEIADVLQKFDTDCSVLRKVSSSEVTRRHLRKYVPRSVISAFGAQVTYPSQSHIIGKQLSELDFGDHRPVILLIRYTDGTYERVPRGDTEIAAGSWIYFGIDTDASCSSPEGPTRLSGTRTDSKQRERAVLEAICQTLFRRKYVPRIRETHAKAGRMVPFMPDFDAFVFPDRKEDGSDYSYVLGQRAWSESEMPLDMRNTMGLNICGIVRVDRDPNGRETHTEQWFPGPHAKARPGDYGLIVRAPREDGYSEPTVVDSDLDILFDKDKPLPTESLDMAEGLNATFWSDNLRFSSSRRSRSED